MEKQARNQAVINNEFYNELRYDWLHRKDHPVALLRAENEARVPWILREIVLRIGAAGAILDVGCGAGLLTNPLALAGFTVTGVDISSSSLSVAKESDKTQSVKYIEANAYSLPFSGNTFDVVCAMDILEHVENPDRLIQEASRVLKPDGLFFFHTFNRNLLSYCVVIKGVEWCVRNTPPNMHVYHLFLKPKELQRLCTEHDLEVKEFLGLKPHLFSMPMLKMLFSREVPSDFSFRFTESLKMGYCGIAIKKLF